jgi:hypothetical protein
VSPLLFFLPCSASCSSLFCSLPASPFHAFILPPLLRLSLVKPSGVFEFTCIMNRLNNGSFPLDCLPPSIRIKEFKISLRGTRGNFNNITIAVPDIIHRPVFHPRNGADRD